MNTDKTEQVELSFREWIVKMNEKLTFAILNIKQRRDITESDYDLLKTLYKPYWRGEYQLFQAKMEGENEDVMQNSLFTDNPSEEQPSLYNGTEIDNIPQN